MPAIFMALLGLFFLLIYPTYPDVSTLGIAAFFGAISALAAAMDFWCAYIDERDRVTFHEQQQAFYDQLLCEAHDDELLEICRRGQGSEGYPS